MAGLERYGFGKHIWDLDIPTLVEARKVKENSPLHHFRHEAKLYRTGRFRDRNNISLGFQPNKTLDPLLLHTFGTRLDDFEVYRHGPIEYGVYSGISVYIHYRVVFDLSAICKLLVLRLIALK